MRAWRNLSDTPRANVFAIGVVELMPKLSLSRVPPVARMRNVRVDGWQTTDKFQMAKKLVLYAGVAELADAPDLATYTLVILLLITVYPFSYMRVKLFAPPR